jgi:hypothetical protein
MGTASTLPEPSEMVRGSTHEKLRRAIEDVLIGEP